MINKKEPQTAATVQGAEEKTSHDDCIKIALSPQVKLAMVRNVCRELQKYGATTIHISTVLDMIGGAEDV